MCGDLHCEKVPQVQAEADHAELNLLNCQQENVFPILAGPFKRGADVAHINQAIIERWSVNALTYIKFHAWKALKAQ